MGEGVTPHGLPPLLDVKDPAAETTGEGAGRTVWSGVLALCAASMVLSLALHRGWIFAKYPNLAALLLYGGLSPEQAADASPLYLLLHAVFEPGTLRALQAVAAAAAVAAVFLIARTVAGTAAGLFAAALLAFAQPWLLHGAVLEPDLFIGALHAAAAALLLVGPRRLTVVAGAGALLGLSVALRPSGALTAVAFLVLVALRGAPGAPRSLGAPAAFVAALGLVAAVPAGALHLVAGQPMAVTMSAGPVTHLGHRPEGTGLGGRYPTLVKLVEAEFVARTGHPPDHAHELYRRFAAAEAGPLEPAQADLFWARKVLAFAREEPRAFLTGLARTLVASVAAGGEDSDVPEARAAARASAVRGLPGRWVVLAGLAGLLVALLARLRGLGLLLAWVAAAELGFLATYFQTRYALAVLPAWCALAGAGASLLTGALREARLRPRRLAALAAVAAAPLCLPLLPALRHEARLHARLAELPARSEVGALRLAGRWHEAEERLVEEQAAFPDYVWPASPRGWALGVDDPALARRAAERARERYGAGDPVDAYLLAALEAAAGRCELALPLAEQAAAAGFYASLDDTSLDPDLLASDCLLVLGRREEARERIARSLARRPGTLDGLARAVAAGVRDEASARRLAVLHDAASARYALSRARQRWGDPESGLADASWLVAHLPEAAPLAQLERARCLAALGRGPEALQAYARTFELQVYLHGMDALTPLVSAFLASAPDDVTVARFALVHLSRVGDLDGVRTVLRRHAALARGRAGPVLPGMARAYGTPGGT